MPGYDPAYCGMPLRDNVTEFHSPIFNAHQNSFFRLHRAAYNKPHFQTCSDRRTASNPMLLTQVGALLSRLFAFDEALASSFRRRPESRFSWSFLDPGLRRGDGVGTRKTPQSTALGLEPAATAIKLPVPRVSAGLPHPELASRLMKGFS
jgi:hypothetical protein